MWSEGNPTPRFWNLKRRHLCPARTSPEPSSTWVLSKWLKRFRSDFRTCNPTAQVCRGTREWRIPSLPRCHGTSQRVPSRGKGSFQVPHVSGRQFPRRLRSGARPIRVPMSKMVSTGPKYQTTPKEPSAARLAPLWGFVRAKIPPAASLPSAGSRLKKKKRRKKNELLADPPPKHSLLRLFR